MLLTETCPEEGWDALAALPIGERDARLLTLREWMFGRALTGMSWCPACGASAELSFSVTDVRGGGEPPSETASAAGSAEGPTATPAFAVEAAGWEVRFRLPTSADLAVLDGAETEEVARERLLERCLLSARRNGKSRPVHRLPARVIEEVVRRMGEADPQADARTTVSCPDCAHQWEATFDIVSFLWAEIEAWARRTLHEVHLLASAYSWGEAEILSLSPRRRRLYVEMVSR